MIEHRNVPTYLDNEAFQKLVEQQRHYQGLLTIVKSGDKRAADQAETSLLFSIKSGIWQHWKSIPEHPMVYFVYRPECVSGSFQVNYLSLYEDPSNGYEYGRRWSRALVSSEKMLPDEGEGFLDPIDREFNGVHYRCPRFTLIEALPERDAQIVIAQNRPPEKVRGE